MNIAPFLKIVHQQRSAVRIVTRIVGLIAAGHRAVAIHSTDSQDNLYQHLNANESEAAVATTLTISRTHFLIALLFLGFVLFEAIFAPIVPQGLGLRAYNDLHAVLTDKALASDLVEWWRRVVAHLSLHRPVVIITGLDAALLPTSLTRLGWLWCNPGKFS